jgi:hypothetical protein
MRSVRNFFKESGRILTGKHEIHEEDREIFLGKKSREWNIKGKTVRK